jgi:hypothetical protein
MIPIPTAIPLKGMAELLLEDVFSTGNAACGTAVETPESEVGIGTSNP